jgi:hypothetical protein
MYLSIKLSADTAAPQDTGGRAHKATREEEDHE